MSEMARERLDKILVDRGLAETRSKAQAMILAGTVLVGNQRIDKAGHMVDPQADIRLKGEPLKYVSRGGLKLEAALQEFGVSAQDKFCLDIGASTGGFTDCLLQQGASRVWAVDVGHNQLAWSIRNNPRVVVMEGQHFRDLEVEQFDVLFELISIDVSFISLTKALPPVLPLMAADADIIALVKPQFEVGKGQVGKGGIVKDPAKHRAVLEQIVEFSGSIGLAARGLIASPILGAEGNREFLMHMGKGVEEVGLSISMKDKIKHLTGP